MHNKTVYDFFFKYLIFIRKQYRRLTRVSTYTYKSNQDNGFEYEMLLK